MSDQSADKAGRWAALSAIGGLLGGAASVIGLFMAKPETITVVVPVPTLERVVEAAKQSSAPAALTPVSTPTPQAPPTAAVSAPAPGPLAWNAPRSMGGDLSAILVSVAEAKDRFVASVRFSNAGAAEKLIALRGQGDFTAEANLTDGFGGSCSLRRDNQETLGTLKPVPNADPQVVESYRSYFTPVPAGGSIVQTFIFNKDKCDSPASGAHPMSVSATLIVQEGDKARYAAVSFEGAPAAQPN